MRQSRLELLSRAVIYMYLVLPVLIFCVGWLRWYWALPCGVLISLACVKSIGEPAEECFIALRKEDGRRLIQALSVIAVWVYLSGIGGYCFQNSDHEIRNAIFRALVEYDWPVLSRGGDRGLIYYIGFWLPAACVGKLFGLAAGYAAQYVWAVFGIFIVYYLICVYQRKVSMLPLAFLILFSGLDYAGTWLLAQKGADLVQSYHLEWWAWTFQYTSMTSQLFWVFNQSVPAWVAVMLIMVQKNSRSTPFILSLMMLPSTIPFVGMIPIAVYLYTRRVAEDRKRWREAFTFQNAVGIIVVGGVSFLYLIGNVSGRMITRDNAAGAVVAQGTTVSEPGAELLRYLLFYFLEFGVYLYFVCRYRRKDPLVRLLVCILLLCPLIKVGKGHDFCMRASVPALMILMLLCMETWERLRAEGRKYLFAAYCAVLLIGAITPFNEMHRSVKETFWRATYGQSVRTSEADIESRLLTGGNFSGETTGIFYHCLARPRTVIHGLYE